MSTKDLQKMVQALPQYSDQIEKLSLHVEVSSAFTKFPYIYLILNICMKKKKERNYLLELTYIYVALNKVTWWIPWLDRMHIMENWLFLISESPIDCRKNK